MNQPNNITKEGHILHSFTSDDHVLGQDKEGNVFRSPMHYELKSKRVCYTTSKGVFALPDYLQIKLLTK